MKMEQTSPSLRLVETDTASVKMTVGKPFMPGAMDSSSSDEEMEDEERNIQHADHKLCDKLKVKSSENDHNDAKKFLTSSKIDGDSGHLDTDGNNLEVYSNAVTNDTVNTFKLTQNQDSSSSAVLKSRRYRNKNFCPVKSGSISDSRSNSGERSYSPKIAVEKGHKTSHSSIRQDPVPRSKSKSTRSPLRARRINPFNKDLLVEEDHFSEAENFFNRHGRSVDSFTSSSSQSQQGFDWQANPEDSSVTFAELGLSEDHFSHPQGHFGLSGAEELELAIENCKELIREATPDSEKQKNLVLKLVQLRIKLQEIKEGPETLPENMKVILSHKMLLHTSKTSKYYCEKCNGGIWGMLQVWYKCTECGYRCHERCLHQILRTCAKAKVLENPVLCLDLCPVDPIGLAAQGYRCAECRTAISFGGGTSEPRLCDYSGQYYCELCHWNDTYKIPARILHNWDFTSYKVCRASKQFMRLMLRKAVIRIQDINPMLFGYVDQLNEIKKLREEMMIMKKYILSCLSAMKAKLLLLLQSRQHFVENSDIYSMQDLLDTEEVLLPELVKVHSAWAQHIKVDCELCQGRGFCCELCEDEEVLFPFDNTAVVCPTCSSVLHRHCFAKRGLCPRCERRSKRKQNKS